MTRSGTWLASAAVIALTVGVTSRADLPTKHELPLPQGSIIIAEEHDEEISGFCIGRSAMRGTDHLPNGRSLRLAGGFGISLARRRRHGSIRALKERHRPALLLAIRLPRDGSVTQRGRVDDRQRSRGGPVGADRGRHGHIFRPG